MGSLGNGATSALKLAEQNRKFIGVEEHETAEGQSIVDQQITEITGDVLNLRPCGYQIAVKIYVRSDEYKTVERADGSKGTIYLPDMSTARDRYASVAALVVAMGPDAYKGTLPDGSPRYAQPWCRVGDWVVIPRYECFQITYKETVALGIISDDKIMAVISDPNDVMAANITDRI